VLDVLVQGVQVSAPFGKVELALDVFRDTLAARKAGGAASKATASAR
jgi:hypothetical protein